MNESRRPCIIGVAHKTYRPKEGDAPHPLLQAAAVARAASVDCGYPRLLQHVDELDVVLPISWPYEALSEQLGRLLGLPDGARRLSGLSGASPQRFINDAADAILHGERQAVLVCGSEAFATLKRARKQQRELAWPQARRPPEYALSDPPLATEVAHNVVQAYTTFALLDSARRARWGIGLDAHRQRQARRMARLSEFAAHEPNAWFQKPHSEAQLFEVTASNRMVAYPFTRNTLACMDVDMAAAVLIVSDRLADELGVTPNKRVYLHGWGCAKEAPYIAQRQDLSRSTALQTAASRALEMAGKTVHEIQYFDLYSCFPSSLDFATDALNLTDDDPRSLTVTGGLPYFGGPGSNYTTHAVVKMVEKLRAETGQFGLVSGIGMHMTDHVFGLYGAERPLTLSVSSPGSCEAQVRDIVSRAHGAARIVAYTVLHEREQQSALAVCELEDGQRCYARCLDEMIVRAMETREWVGKTVTLRSGEDNLNVF